MKEVEFNLSIVLESNDWGWTITSMTSSLLIFLSLFIFRVLSDCFLNYIEDMVRIVFDNAGQALFI